ncbi:MAG: helix-turn-helix domain-containing protein [Leucobacter sp.]
MGVAMLINTTSDVVSLVRARRIEAGMTQDQLAEKVSMSRQWVRNLEAGIGAPAFPGVLAVIHALGLEVSVEQPSSDSDVDAMFEGL